MDKFKHHYVPYQITTYMLDSETSDPHTIQTAHKILEWIHYYSFVVQILLLLTFFIFRTIYLSKSTPSVDDGKVQVYGPGGKPLPQRRLTEVKLEEDSKNDFPPTKKWIFIILNALAMFTFLAGGMIDVVHSFYKPSWMPGEAMNIYHIGNFFSYSVLVISISDANPSPTIVQQSIWYLTFIFETMRLAAFVTIHRTPPNHITSWIALEVVCNVLRIFFILAAIILYLLFTLNMTSYFHGRDADQERTPLLTTQSLTETSSGAHGRTNGHADGILPSSMSSATINPNHSTAHPSTTNRTQSLHSTHTHINSDNENENDLYHDPDHESQPLSNSRSRSNVRNYGAISTSVLSRKTNNQQDTNQESHDTKPGWERPVKAPSRAWYEYFKGYGVFFSYLWPAKDRSLQARIPFCIILLILQRVVNIYVPYQIGVVTDWLSNESNSPYKTVPVTAILLYITYRLLQGTTGLIASLRGWLWLPISQYSYRELSVASYEHVFSLGLDFHLNKKIGEVSAALGKGKAINNFLDQITFQVIPMIVDLLVAIVYFLVVFDNYYALIVTIVTFWYMYVTVRLAQWRAEARRKMANAGRENDAVINDSMSSYEVVKYFNAEQFEFDRYRRVVGEYQTSEYTVQLSLQIMNVCQNFLFLGGVMIICFIAAYQVTHDNLTVGKFTSVLTYMAQLQVPLNNFGSQYKSIQGNMINSERLLELFKEQPKVTDSPTAKDLTDCAGDIKFKNVSFGYDGRKDALQGLDFHCKAGTTVAFVGDSGGGKSTILRLLFRFYNPAAGTIQIDDQDVQDLKIESVRRNIGVVSQDTILFNESVMYNLKYANPQATDEQVYDACNAASIHERILSFPDGYNNIVGERGLKLSGGEKQRVAIARTILKGSKIILLDEATSSLDVETERNVQIQLEALSKGRTTLLIAHRLSTVVNADRIYFLSQGRVLERGTHAELMARKGRYETMWNKSVQASEAALESHKLKLKAVRLRRESKGQTTIARVEELGSLQDRGPQDNEREQELRRDQAEQNLEASSSDEGEQKERRSGFLSKRGRDNTEVERDSEERRSDDEIAANRGVDDHH